MKDTNLWDRILVSGVKVNGTIPSDRLVVTIPVEGAPTSSYASVATVDLVRRVLETEQEDIVVWIGIDKRTGTIYYAYGG